MDQDIRTTRYTLGQVITAGGEQFASHIRGILPVFLIVYIPLISRFRLSRLIISLKPTACAAGPQRT